MEINIEKWLLENGFNDVVTNALLYQKNTPENAIKWLYVSDILKMFVEKECDGILVKLNKANVIKSVCDECNGTGRWKENEQDKEINCPKCNKQTVL